MANVAKDLAQLISQSKSNKTGPYDTQATVKRIEGKTVWVSIPGGVDETPIEKTINCKAGDKVQVRVSGGRAWITGNATAPPTDDATAVQAQTVATYAQGLAVDAKETADAVEDIALSAQQSASTAAAAAAQAVLDAGAAQSSANAAQASADNAADYAARALGNLSTVQSVAETLTWITQHGTMTLTSDVSLDPTHVYFVVDAGGDYTVGGTTYAIVTEPDVDDIGTYYELSIDESLNNYVGTHLALDTEGLWLLPASSGTNKVLIATGAGSTYTTAGTYIIDSSGNTVASFRANGATIGEAINGNSRAEIGTDGMRIIQKDNGSDTEIAHLGYGQANDSGGGVTDAPYYTLGTRQNINSPGVGAFSTSNVYQTGDRCSRNGKLYVAMEDNITGAWDGSKWLDATLPGVLSTAVGEDCCATSADAYAEGFRTVSAGAGPSHAEGYESIATGTYASHAEGLACFAFGEYGSHAEGYRSIVEPSGYTGHAEGEGTKVTGSTAAHAEGNGSVASGDASHAQNEATIAASNNQTALGKYNVADNADTYAVIVGNGTYNARSNALTVDWSGNVDADGDITDGSGNVLSDKLEEDANGDLSITRNITAGGTVNATTDVTIGGVSIKKASSATVTTQITAGTHANVSSATITKIAGYIGFLEVTLTTKNAMTAGTNYNDLCTIGGTIAPDRCFIASSNSGVIAIGNSGTVQMRPTVAISNGGTVYLRAIYLLA